MESSSELTSVTQKIEDLKNNDDVIVRIQNSSQWNTALPQVASQEPNIGVIGTPPSPAYKKIRPASTIKRKFTNDIVNSIIKNPNKSSGSLSASSVSFEGRKPPELGGDNTPPGGTTPNSRDVIPKSPNPYGLNYCSNETVWSEDIKDYFIEFIEVCRSSSNKCRKSAIRHSYIDKFLSIFQFFAGTVIFVTSFGSIVDDSTRSYFGIVCGIITAAIAAIQAKGSYDKLSEIESQSCRNLEKMVRIIRLEIVKPPKYRVDPQEFIIHLENEREKILKKVSIVDD